MSRTVFSLVIPAFLAAMAGLLVLVAIAAGFQGEACRFAGNAASRRDGALEWLLIQACVFVPFALLLFGLASALRSRLPGGGARFISIRLCVGLALGTFAALTLQQLIFVTFCNVGQLAYLGRVLGPVAMICAYTFVLAVAYLFVRGLMTGQPGVPLE